MVICSLELKKKLYQYFYFSGGGVSDSGVRLYGFALKQNY